MHCEAPHKHSVDQSVYTTGEIQLLYFRTLEQQPNELYQVRTSGSQHQSWANPCACNPNATSSARPPKCRSSAKRRSSAGRSEDSSREPGTRYPALAPATIRSRWGVGGPQRANGGERAVGIPGGWIGWGVGICWAGGGYPISLAVSTSTP